MLFVGSDDRHVYALNATDGALLWKSDGVGFVLFANPVLNPDETAVFVGDKSGYINVFRTSDGKLLWK